MKPSTDTTSGEIATGNPRDAFTAEHQRMAWEIAAWAINRAHRVVTTDKPRAGEASQDPRELLALALQAMKIATGAL